MHDDGLISANGNLMQTNQFHTHPIQLSYKPNQYIDIDTTKTYANNSNLLIGSPSNTSTKCPWQQKICKIIDVLKIKNNTSRIGIDG